jgi:chromosome segregation ATPase
MSPKIAENSPSSPETSPLVLEPAALAEILERIRRIESKDRGAAERDRLLAHLAELLRARDRALSNLEEALRRADARRAELEAAREVASAGVEEARRAAAEERRRSLEAEERRVGLLDRAQAEVEGARKSERAANARLEESKAALASAAARIEDARAAERELRARLESRERETEEVRGLLAQSDARACGFEEALARAIEESRRALAEIALRDVSIGKLREQLRDRDAKLDRIRRTLPYRAYRGLRKLLGGGESS